MVNVQAVQVRQQLLVDEVKQLAITRRKQRLAPPAKRLALNSLRVARLV